MGRLRRQIGVFDISRSHGILLCQQKLETLFNRIEQGDFESRERLAIEIAHLLEQVKADTVFSHQSSARRAVLEEANRPEGIPLPERFGEAVRGIFIPRGVPTFIGAYSGIGKTRTLMNLVYDTLVARRISWFFTHEMTPGQLWILLCGIWLNLKHGKSPRFADVKKAVRDGDETVFDFIDHAEKYIRFVDASGFCASRIVEAYELLWAQTEQDPDTVFIDYLQIVRPEPELRGNERRQQVIETVERITEKAKRTNAAWIIAAQTNRSSHQRRSGETPDHSSFQESAAIEQNAGLTIMLSRTGETERLRINIPKNRFGRTGDGEIVLDLNTGAIRGDGVIRTIDDVKAAQEGREYLFRG
jgi:DnaB-like helicase C terminal domain